MASSKKIQLSPNSLNLFLECPGCFWLEKREGIKRPEVYPYSLNAEVDLLLKKEFDSFREKGEKHPLLRLKKIPAKLFSNKKLLDEWRDNQKGIRYYDPDLDAIIFGAVDDVLEFKDGKLAPMDYKSTGSAIPKVYDRFQLQMDVYTYLLERNGYATPRKGYLVFYVVDKNAGFNGRLPFKKELYEIETDPADVLDIFKDAVAFLRKSNPPSHSPDCQFGKWLKAINKI